MEEKRLYPLGFCSLADSYPWGTDEFLLADLGYRDSLIRDGWLAGNSMSELMDTYMDRVVGENAFEFWGRQFPLQVKRISVKGVMPLRVHPDAETAVQRYDFLGREKLWYVVRAGKDARILAGWARGTDASEVWNKCLDGTAETLLKSFPAESGDYLHIPPGTPHAAAGDVEIVEISESSPLDFCLSGLGADVHPDEFDEALSLVDALDFMDYKAFEGSLQKVSGAAEEVLADMPEFHVVRRVLDAPVRVDGDSDTFVLYTCISGAASVQMDVLGRIASFDLSAGRTVLVPAECAAYAVVPREADTVILETTVPHRTERDAYIDG